MGGFAASSESFREAIGAINGPGVGHVLGAFLGFVFLMAGTLKLRNPLAAADALLHFGVLRTVRPRGARLLGGIELTMGLGLAAQLRAVAGVSLGFLALSMLLIGRSLLRNERFACSCFGLHPAPITWLSFVRTASLTATALVVTVSPESSANRVDGYVVPAVLAASLLAVVVLTSCLRMLLVCSDMTLNRLRGLPS